MSSPEIPFGISAWMHDSDGKLMTHPDELRSCRGFKVSEVVPGQQYSVQPPFGQHAYYVQIRPNLMCNCGVLGNHAELCSHLSAVLLHTDDSRLSDRTRQEWLKTLTLHTSGRGIPFDPNITEVPWNPAADFRDSEFVQELKSHLESPDAYLRTRGYLNAPHPTILSFFWTSPSLNTEQRLNIYRLYSSTEAIRVLASTDPEVIRYPEVSRHLLARHHSDEGGIIDRLAHGLSPEDFRAAFQDLMQTGPGRKVALEHLFGSPRFLPHHAALERRDLIPAMQSEIPETKRKARAALLQLEEIKEQIRQGEPSLNPPAPGQGHSSF